MSDYIIGGGGDVNAKDSDGMTLLHKAAWDCDVEKCKELLSRVVPN